MRRRFWTSVLISICFVLEVNAQQYDTLHFTFDEFSAIGASQVAEKLNKRHNLTGENAITVQKLSKWNGGVQDNRWRNDKTYKYYIPSGFVSENERGSEGEKAVTKSDLPRNVGDSAFQQNDTHNNSPLKKKSGNSDSDLMESNSSLWWLWLLTGLIGGAVGSEYIRRKWPVKKSSAKVSSKEVAKLRADKQEIAQKAKAATIERDNARAEAIREKQRYEAAVKEMRDLKEKFNSLDAVHKAARKEADFYKQQCEVISQQQVPPATQDFQQPKNVECHVPAGPPAQSPTRSPVQPAAPDTTSCSVATLYASAIVNGILHQVTERPTEDTVFRLDLCSNTTAKVTVHPNAYARIIANPAFLEGCNKQVLANASTVLVKEAGAASLQADGKWHLHKTPNVIIK